MTADRARRIGGCQRDPQAGFDIEDAMARNERMTPHRESIFFDTDEREQLVDVTDRLKKIADACPEACLMALFAKGATAAVMIQENWDPAIRDDILDCLRRIVPRGEWRHDRVDGNADAHIKAGLVGPSATIPLDGGKLLLGTWQNVFFCELDGPREGRELIVTLV
jgi:secondary thiamine-phosphate synthase enzyme